MRTLGVQAENLQKNIQLNQQLRMQNQHQVISVSSYHRMLSLMLYLGSENVMREVTEYAIFLRISHANSEFARRIWLPCAADLPISYI
jgi:hypothetical protein